MFTVKYRYYMRAKTQPVDGPTLYDEMESLNGPYEFVSQERDDEGYMVIYAHHAANPESLPMTFGPFRNPSNDVPPSQHPRPTLWVMNAQGATVATYHL